MKKPAAFWELYIGIGASVVFFMLLGIFLIRPYWIFIVALLLGGMLACLQVYDMYRVLDVTLSAAPDKAKSFTTLRAIIRMAIQIVVMAGALLIHWSAFTGVAVGLLSLKISAFLNPYIKKVIFKFGISFDSDEHNKA